MRTLNALLCSGLHLEIDPRGEEEMSIYEKEEGGDKAVHVHKHMYTRVV